MAGTPASSRGGSTPTLASVLATGGDPSSNPITGRLNLNIPATGVLFEVTKTGGGHDAYIRAASADMELAVLSDTGGAAKLTLDEPTGAARTTLSTLDGVTITSRDGLGATDELLTVESGFWGTVLIISAGQTFVGAPMLFASPPILQNHAAPSDGSLVAGDCALWFDQTNGAAKLMLKAKQADGTVKTGSVNVQT